MENLNIKKIIVYVIIILFIGILGYFIFSSDEDTDVQPENTDTFFPIGEVGQVDLGKDFEELRDDPDYINNSSSEAQIPILRKISNEPVVGAVIFSPELKNKENIEDYYIIRYIEKTTGYIYETSTNKLTLNRISNKIIPKLNKANWLDKDNLIFNYLDDDEIIKTYSGILSSTATSTQVDLNGVYLQNDIQDIVYFDEKLFYLLNSGSNSSGILVNRENIEPKHIFYSPLKEWLISNIDDNLISFTTKTSKETVGYMFIFNNTSKTFNKVLDEKLNLSTLVNSDLDILYSFNSKLEPQLSFYNSEEKTTSTIPIFTFPEKCVWSKNNIDLYCGVPTQLISMNSLDDWYKGNILFSDEIWKINTETNQTKKIISPSDLEENGIDMIDLSITDDGNYLTFINKKDYTLWGLQIISNY